MKYNYFKLVIIFLLGAILVVYTNCGKPGVLTFENGYYVGPYESYGAFESTVWPITRANCASCHSEIQPKHASSDAKEAHDAALTKVNFNNIPASRLVAKLRDENHNCWSDCSENAAQMQKAIEAWSASRGVVESASGPTDTDVYTDESSTMEVEFADTNNAASSNTVMIGVEGAMLVSPMSRTQSENGTYISVPNNNGGAKASGDASAGVAYMNFKVPVTGTYRLWGHLNGPTDNDNSFYARIKNGNTNLFNPQTWNIPTSSQFSWIMQGNINQNLTAGVTYTLEIREREDGAKALGFILTADPDFNAADVGDFFGVTLRYDLSNIVNVPNTYFEINVVDYDLYSYKFSKPRIISNANFKVKNLKLLVNGEFNPQHSTYTIVDKIVTPSDNQLSNYSMVVLKDRGNAGDKISFSFEELYSTSNTGTTTAGATGGVTGQDSLTAYQQTVYPISRSSSYACVGCHNTRSPAHASSNPQTAHDATLSVVNFNSPADSRIVKKVREEQHNCGANCSSIATQYENAIIEWRNRRQ